MVNIPTFELHGYAGGHERLTMRVVTGQPDSPTPIFAREMTTVVFSPYWNVPTNILRDEGGLICPMFNDWVEGRRAEVGGWVASPQGTMMNGFALSKCWLNA